jgi:hypothetical protein
MYIVNNLMKFLRLNLFLITKCYINYRKHVLKTQKTIRTKVKWKSLNFISKQKARQNYVI